MSHKIMHPPSEAFRRIGRPPFGMSSMVLPREHHEMMMDVALGIWTAMVSNGRSLQDAILAVYLSGVEHGTMAGREGGGNG